MSKVSRRKFGSDFKFKVALSALKEEKTLEELSQQYEVHMSLIKKWKKHLIDTGASIFLEGSGLKTSTEDAEIKELRAKVGELTMCVDFLKKKLPS